MNTAGSFVSIMHGIDVPSHRQYTQEQVSAMLKQLENQSFSMDKFKVYLEEEGGYADIESQIPWYGENITQRALQEATSAEMLEPYQVIKWTNFIGQKKDLDAINNAILIEDDLALTKLIESKSRWHVYTEGLISN